MRLTWQKSINVYVTDFVCTMPWVEGFILSSKFVATGTNGGNTDIYLLLVMKERPTTSIFTVNHVFRISIVLLHVSALHERHL
jgi:hypothetical protein